MKIVLRGMFVIAIAVGLAACVKQLWKVTYSGQENYSVWSGMVVGSDGVAYISGTLESGDLFVASYDGAGQLRWDQVISVSDVGSNILVGNMLVLDANGAIYLSSITYPSLTGYLFKFSVATGEPIFTKELALGELYTGLKIGPDNVLYFSGYSGLAAFDTNGDFLWSYPGEASSDVAAFGWGGQNDEAQPLPEMSRTAVNATSINQHNNIAFGAARMFAVLAGQLLELDRDGQVVQQISSDVIGLSTVDSLQSFGDSLLLIGSGQQATVSVWLDLDFNVQQRKELSVGSLDPVVVASGDVNIACVAMIDDLAGLTTVQQLDATGSVRWSVPVMHRVLRGEFVSVLASDNNCYLSAPEMSVQNVVATKTRRFDGQGKLTDTISLPRFLGTHLTVQGNAIFHAGVSEEEVNATELKATLIKHQRY